MPTLSLECSKKIYDLLGNTYETESKHCRERIKSVWHPWFISKATWPTNHSDFECVPAPSFAETIRLLPKIARKKGLRPHNEYHGDEEPMQDHLAKEIAVLMMDAPTEEEGMERVSEYLEKII